MTAVAPELFVRLAPVPPGTGVIALARRPRVDPAAILAAPDPEPVVLLDRPSHLGNVGAVVRVAAAAGAAAVLTTGPLDPWHPAALRGAAGLHFALPVARLARLPATARPLVTLDPRGEPLGRAAIPPSAVLVVGAERGGVSPDLCARAATRVRDPDARGRLQPQPRDGGGGRPLRDGAPACLPGWWSVTGTSGPAGACIRNSTSQGACHARRAALLLRGQPERHRDPMQAQGGTPNPTPDLPPSGPIPDTPMPDPDVPPGPGNSPSPTPDLPPGR